MRGRAGTRVRGPEPSHRIRLDAKEYATLRRLARRRTAPHAEVIRAKILVLAYEHPEWSNATIAQAVGCTDRTVRKWRARARDGPCLGDTPRSGKPRFFSLGPTRPGDGTRVHPAAGLRPPALALVQHRVGGGRPGAGDRRHHLGLDHPALAPGGEDQALAVPQLAATDRPPLSGTRDSRAQPVPARAGIGGQGPSGGLRG
jgi:Homeodomain-like domain